MDRVAVAVEDLAFLGRRADRDQLVARGKEGNPQLAVHRDLADAQRRDEADFRRPQRKPPLECDLSHGEVFAGAAQVLALLVPGPKRDPAAFRFDVLLHHDSVGSGRHDSARHDADAFAGLHRALERRAGKGAAGNLERNLTVALEIGEARRVAVHRRVVVRGDIKWRDDVLGQHAPERNTDVNAFGHRDRGEETADEFARLGDRHRIRIVVVGAAQLAQGLRLVVHCLTSFNCRLC